MKIRKNGINFLLAVESVILIIVLVFGIISGAAEIRNNSSGNSDNEITFDTEVTGEDLQENTSNASEETVDNTGKWQVPEEYTEGCLTFSKPVEAMLKEMTVEEKVAQLFIVSPEDLTGYDNVTMFGEASEQALDNYSVGGVVYSTANYQDELQMNELVEGATNYYKEKYHCGLFTFMQTKAKLPKAIEDANATGINVLLGTTKDIKRIASTGIHPGVKGFPGTAGTKKAESGVLYNEATLEDLSKAFPSYQEGIDDGAQLIVVRNVVAESITGDENVPCSLSDRTVGLIRENMGYKGLLITDDFSEKGFVSVYGEDNVCVEAINAGMDMIYMPANFEKAYQAILDAVNSKKISEDRLNNAVGRILTIKGIK